MCRGRPPAPPPPPPPRPLPPPPEPTAGRVVTGGDRVSTPTRTRTKPRPTGTAGTTVKGQQRAVGMPAGSRRSTRATTARRLGTSSLRIPLLSTSDLNYPV